MVKLFNVVSLDGFVSDNQQHLVWQCYDEKTQYPLQSEQFNEFFKGVDYILLGEQAFMDTYQNWPYADKQVVVFAQKEILLKHERKVTYIYTDPVEYCRKNAISNAWLVGGSRLINQFLNAGLIKEIHLFQVPVLIGEGVQLFRVTQLQRFKVEETQAILGAVYSKLVV